MRHRDAGLLGATLAILCTSAAVWGLPAGFVEEAVDAGWNNVCGLTFDDHGRLFAWERSGRVWIVEGGVRQSTPFADLTAEVGGWRDYGLLGFALHPNYINTGFVYFFYVVDRHHLMHFGTPQYDAATNEYFDATIGRIVRYRAAPGEGSTDYSQSSTIDLSTRTVLVGESKEAGVPILHQSHGVGALVFGSDGTLLASCGDGASYLSLDTGDAPESYAVQGLVDGIVSSKENIGAFRAQLLDSLSGKILRIDPETGDGVASNPFFDPARPRSAQSRVWSLGLRNPCRMALRPGTGSHRPADGDPGVLYVGDVGWGRFEDLHVVTAPAQNFGWPLFEGLTPLNDYWIEKTPNLDAPNPLFGPDCEQEFFYFQDLLQQETRDGVTRFLNPCDLNQEIPSGVAVFSHSRPAIDWGRGVDGPARTGVFAADGTAQVATVGAVDSPIVGSSFPGNASIGGAWYTEGPFPVEYHNTYFHADYGERWIRRFRFDANDRLLEVDEFISGRRVVAIAMNPVDGCLYYVDYGANIWKVSYVPRENQPPLVVARQDRLFGVSPLVVAFDASGSMDPEGRALAYSWDFGDGASSTEVSPQHVFRADGGGPRRFDVKLRVTDAESAFSEAELIVSVNNTPPVVRITSPVDGTQYPMTRETAFDLTAEISDGESAQGDLICAWQTSLHHNNHTHDEDVDPNCSTTSVISPIGCDGQAYFYRVTLTVSDPAGLSTVEEVTLFPACDGLPPVARDDHAVVNQGYAVEIDVLSNDFDPDGEIDPMSIRLLRLPQHGTLDVAADGGVVMYTHDGSDANADTFSYVVADDTGSESNPAWVFLEAVNDAPSVKLESPTVGDTFRLGDSLQLQAEAFDLQDGSDLTYRWQLHFFHNDHVHEEVFVWDGPDPPAVRLDGTPDVADGDRYSYLVLVSVEDVVGVRREDAVHLLAAELAPNAPPQARFRSTPASGSAPLRVVFDAEESTDPDRDALVYSWSFGDGHFGRGATAEHIYSDHGVYYAQLQIVDAGGAHATRVELVTVTELGLDATYFDGANLSTPLLQRVDPQINFDWGAGTPDSTVDPESFSVRWVGRVRPQFSELYTFHTVSDGGLRLWIDNIAVVDRWELLAFEEQSGSIELRAGVNAALVVEYFHAGGDAVAQLSWSSPSQAREAVPADALLRPLGGNQPPVVDAGPPRVGVAGGVVHLLGRVVDDGLPENPGRVHVQWHALSGPAAPTWPTGDSDDEHTHVLFPATGTYELRLTASDGAANHFDDVTVTVVAAAEFRRGDANDDDRHDISDAIFALRSLFSGQSGVHCQAALDSNDDGAVDVSDPVYLLNHLVAGGDPVPAPFPGCGADPTSDALSCLESSCGPLAAH